MNVIRVRPTILVSLLLLSGAAHADILSFSSTSFSLSTDATASSGSTATNVKSLSIDVPQFDPTLGTLTGIMLSISGLEQQITFTVDSSGGILTGILTGGGQTTRQISLLGLPTTNVTLNHFTSCSASTCIFTDPIGGLTTPSFFNSGYIGTGQVAELLTLTSSATVSGGVGVVENKGSWTGQITGEYTYTPETPGVPEPTSIAFLFGAAGAVAFVSLRKSPRLPAEM